MSSKRLEEANKRWESCEEGSRARGHRQPLEAGKVKENDASPELLEGTSPTDTLTVAQRD